MLACAVAKIPTVNYRYFGVNGINCWKQNSTEDHQWESKKPNLIKCCVTGWLSEKVFLYFIWFSKNGGSDRNQQKTKNYMERNHFVKIIRTNVSF